MTNALGAGERDLSNGEQAQGDDHTLTLNGQTYAKASEIIPAPTPHAIRGCTRFQATSGSTTKWVRTGASTSSVLDGVKTLDSG